MSAEGLEESDGGERRRVRRGGSGAEEERKSKGGEEEWEYKDGTIELTEALIASEIVGKI